MKKIIITASDGEKLTGQLPDVDQWDDVRLDAFAGIVAARKPEGTDVSELCHAVALLTGLPAEPLLDDASLLAVIVESSPWLFGGEHLPPAGEPVPLFTHAGIKYVHVGNLSKISAGQLEALLTFLQANEGNQLNCGPQLLAVLYCPKGKKQTPVVVRDTAAAFCSLPMSVAWPALSDFIVSSGSAAERIQTVSALSAQLAPMVAALEKATTGVSRTFWLRPLNWLARLWLRNVRRML